MRGGHRLAGTGRRSLLWLVPWLLAWPSHAGAPGVEAGFDAGAWRLADGRVVKLAGIELPASSDMAEAAAVAAAILATGPPVLEPEPAPLDRHGRLRVQLRGADGSWLQGELVQRGLALVAPAADVPGPVLAAAAGARGRHARTGAGCGRAAGAGRGRPSGWPPNGAAMCSCAAACRRSRGRRSSSISISAMTGGATSRFGWRPAGSGGLARCGFGSEPARGSRVDGAGRVVRGERADDRGDPPSADRAAAMSRRCARMLAATLALALAACTPGAQPGHRRAAIHLADAAAGEGAGPRGASQGAGPVRRALSRPRCRRPMSSGSATGSRTRPS